MTLFYYLAVFCAVLVAGLLGFSLMLWASCSWGLIISLRICGQ